MVNNIEVAGSILGTYNIKKSTPKRQRCLFSAISSSMFLLFTVQATENPKHRY